MAKQGRSTVVPRLRFPEFRESTGWSVSALADVADFVNEKITSSSVSTTNYVSTENLLQGYGGVAAASKLPAVDSVTRFRAGDVLISNIRPYLKKVWHADRDGGASNDVMVVRAKGQASSTYLASVLKSDSFIAYVMVGAKGVKMPRGDVDSIRRYPVAHPGVHEQQKITDCLTSLDELIAAQGRKVEALKTYKRGLMQQLFPREGETLPRLRFPEFRDAPEWKLRPLGQMTSKVGSGITPLGGDRNYKAHGRPFVRSQNVGWGELLLDDVAYIDDETHLSFDATEIQLHDVLLNITGASIGRSAVADARIVGGNVNQHVCIIRLRPDELSPALLNQFLISERGQKQIDDFQAGGNRQGLNFAQIRSFEIPLPPTRAEQQRVAECLVSLDARIAVEAEKLESLKTHKKGLMQQLFPAPEEA